MTSLAQILIDLEELNRRIERDTQVLTIAINNGNVRTECVMEILESVCENANAKIDTPLVLPCGEAGT